MTEEARQWPAWPGEIDLGKLPEVIGDDGLWAHLEHARLIDRMCRDLGNSPVSLIEYCQREFPERFEEYVIKEERRRLGGAAPMRVPGTPTPESAKRIAQLESDWIDRRSRGKSSMQYAAAQHVARDVRLEFLKQKSALAGRARTLLAHPEYQFVGVRGGKLSDRILPRFAANAEFDWLRGRVVVLPTGQISIAGAIVWENVYVSSPAVVIAAREEARVPSDSETMLPAAPPIALAPPLRKGGRKPTERDGMLAYLQKHHPDGVPAGLKNKELLHRMHVDGVNGSDKTLRRAMKEQREDLAKTQ